MSSVRSGVSRREFLKGASGTLATLAGALWRTLREQPASHQLLTELTMVALRTPHLHEAVDSHYRATIAVTAKLVTEAAERTGRELAQPAETIARFFLTGFDGLILQRLVVPDDTAEDTVLRALVSATIGLAGGSLPLVDMTAG